MTFDRELEQKLEQLGQTVAPGPSLKQAVMADIKKQPEPGIVSLSLWRRLMRSPRTRVTAAAVLITGTLLGLLMLSETSSLVLADVLTSIQEVESFSFKTHMWYSGRREREVVNETLVSKTFGMITKVWHVDPNSGKHRISQEVAMQLAQKGAVIVMHDEKIVMHTEFGDRLVQTMGKEIVDPRDMLQRVQNCIHQSLGVYNLDGIEVEGFHTTDPNYLKHGSGIVDVKIWVNVQSKLPVRLEEDITRPNGDRRHAVSDQFQWHVPVSADQFEPVIPEDYILPNKIVMPDPDVEAALIGLSWYRDRHGTFPKSLDSVPFGMTTEGEIEIPDGLSEIEKRALFMDALKQGKIRAVPTKTNGLATFHGVLTREDRDAVYYGETVTPDYPHAVLWRWRSDAGRYRVVSGDLNLREVTPDELARLEALPLNLEPQAIKPFPADDTAGCPAPVLALSWLSGYEATSHRIYLGPDPENLNLIAEVSGASYLLNDLERDKSYCWRVDSVQADGGMVAGVPWCFDTHTLLGWWRFNQADETVAKDELGQNDGDLKNMDSQCWVAGLEGSALRFDGVDDYVEIPRLIQDDWTISFWMKTDQPGPKGWGWWAGQGLVDGDIQGIREDFGTALLNGKIYYGVAENRPNYPGEIIHSKTMVDDDQWHHIAATRSLSTGRMELYVDGVLEAHSIGTKGSKNDSPVLCIGRLNNEKPIGYFQGEIDEVRLYSHVLSGEAIDELYTAMKP